MWEKEKAHQAQWNHRQEQALQHAQNDRIHHYHCDHLGTPQALYNEDGQEAWSARYQAWGRIYRFENREVEQPLRFQGQYEDEETGLYYNRYRYYDPDAGRYISQDPIGLMGAENLYQYTVNSITWIDPLGLAHHVFWRHYDKTGRLLGHGRMKSGYASPCGCTAKPGRRLTRKEQLATHTEHKVLEKLKHTVTPGDRIEIIGLQYPCNPGYRGCKWKMDQFSKRHQVTIDYRAHKTPQPKTGQTRWRFPLDCI